MQRPSLRRGSGCGMTSHAMALDASTATPALLEGFGRAVRRRFSTPIAEHEGTEGLQQRLEILARERFPGSEGFVLEVRRSSGHVRALQLVLTRDSFRAVCTITTHVTGGGYRDKEAAMVTEVHRHATRRSSLLPYVKLRLSGRGLLTAVVLLPLLMLSMVRWLPAVELLGPLLYCAVLLVVERRERRRQKEQQRQRSVSIVEAEQQRWRAFGEQVDAAIEEHRSLPATPSP